MWARCVPQPSWFSARPGDTRCPRMGARVSSVTTGTQEGMRVRVIAVFSCMLLMGVLASTAAAKSSPARGHFVHAFNANQSNNWYGYNQGALETGKSLFHSVSGDWTVPTASQHTSGNDEYSSTWIGIGGGCVTADCAVTDSTLIQTGT